MSVIWRVLPGGTVYSTWLLLPLATPERFTVTPGEAGVLVPTAEVEPSVVGVLLCVELPLPLPPPLPPPDDPELPEPSPALASWFLAALTAWSWICGFKKANQRMTRMTASAISAAINVITQRGS